jgi:hypothetical protein
VWEDADVAASGVPTNFEAKAYNYCISTHTIIESISIQSIKYGVALIKLSAEA